MTDWAKLWKSPGPQDAEQNFPGFLSAGLNFGDFMIAFGPKPVTMLTGIRDYFPIDGARDTYAEVKRVFEVLDAPGRAGYFEYDDEHGWHKPRREATYRWLAKSLQNRDDDGAEPPIKPEPESNLNATSTGQVATSLGGETVQSLNLKLAWRLFGSRSFLNSSDPIHLREIVAQRLNLRARAGAPSVSEPKPGHLLIETEPGIRVPAVLSLPPSKKGRHPAVLLVDSAGKGTPAEQENVVLSIDPRGWGESAPDKPVSGYSGIWQLAQRAMLIGRPLPGMQVYDVLRAFDYLRNRPDVDASQVSIKGTGKGGVLALYAAALEPAIASVSIEDAPLSYMAIARAKTHSGMIDIVVPGVLKDFDLPDLAGLIAPRSLQILSARAADGTIVKQPLIQQEYASAVKRYGELKHSDALRIGP